MENQSINRKGQRITVLKSPTQAGRVKVVIPYRMEKECEAFKPEFDSSSGSERL